MTTKTRNVTKGKKPETSGEDTPVKVRPKGLVPAWQPGQSGNPLGRPVGSRSKFSEAMVSDFLADWHAHGNDVLARVRMTDPATYLRVAAVLVPREMKVEVEQKTFGSLSREAYAVLRRLVDLIQAAGIDGAPEQVFAMIEDDLRARLAQPVTKPIDG